MKKQWYWIIGIIFLILIVFGTLFYFTSSKKNYNLREEMKKEDFDIEAYNLRFIDGIDSYKDLCISLCDPYEYKSHLVLGGAVGGNSATKNIVCDCIMDKETTLRIFYDFINQQIYGNITEEN